MSTIITSSTYCTRHVLQPQGCADGSDCPLRHDIFLCTCKLILLTDNEDSHKRGRRHRDLLAGRADPRDQNRTKFATRRAYIGLSLPNNIQNVSAGGEWLTRCPQCSRDVENSIYQAHLDRHAKQRRRNEIRSEIEATADDKEGVTVTAKNGIDFGVSDGTTSREIRIYVKSTEANVDLRSVRMRSSVGANVPEPKFNAIPLGNKNRIYQGASRPIVVTLYPKYDGYYEDVLELVFFHVQKRNIFIITRSVEATIGSSADHDELRAKEPYKRRMFTKFLPRGRIVRSIRPAVWSKSGWKVKLGGHDAPVEFIKSVYGPGINPKKALAAIKTYMPPFFSENTYGAWFQVLLWLEEERVKLDLDAYSLTDAELKPDYPRYNLLVQGLAENRPSVLVGDFIQVSHTGYSDNPNTRVWHEGRVHKVRESDVGLQFGDDFSTYRGTKFDVRFVLNRLPYRRMHDALSNAFSPARFLFPDASHIRGARRVSPAVIAEIRPYDRPLGSDEEQIETVAAILNQRPGSVPFVVFGPPGTGKTVTIVEAMRQLLDADENFRILACAPNNSAADTIARKLSILGNTKVFRLNAVSRKLDDMGKDLRPFCCINGNEFFAMPGLEEIKQYRVVVSTCLSACVPASLGLKRGHFSHIFVDEAGQGKEPEVMVAIKSIADEKTNVVLAGDNQQLGPVVHCHLASSLGLKTSYLSRIMQQDIYNLETGRGITIVKLLKNFRSHPDILQFSNDQFYNSELQTCGNAAMIHSLENYEELPRKRFPLIFHGIVGKDEREAKSPSFFNIAEVTQVKRYCMSLLEDKKYRLKPEHIGVITPYHAQRCKILDAFRKDVKMREVKVGSVEEFQGQERRVIIMSTVRSNTEFVGADIRRSLGFVANKSRLNVALTRAQALLIVIGNPIVLSLDPLWRQFLNYIHIRGGWRGKEIDWNPEDAVLPDGEYATERQAQEDMKLEETMDRLRAMIIDKHAEDGLNIGDVNADLGDDSEEDEAAAFERPILREAE